MFRLTRPSTIEIEEFVDRSRSLSLTYAPVGLVRDGARPPGTRVDEQVVAIGRGPEDFARARDALRAWRQFDLEWISVWPRDAGTADGTVVAVLIRHLGFWSLNGCRVVYQIGSGDRLTRFGYAYGALTNHAEGGEEIFEVFIDPASAAVCYRIRAASWPRAALARAGQPIVRHLQARFRRESAQAMARAVARV